ncbi:MAG: hypothetical protein LRY76_02035 [Alphaproteobacteria bacterium]|nr:hypothetical protein [Alphaproteobacteria bacterium]MCD8570311.1 hypothetical protein [Alphaproteobacteria bacterium]
MALGFQMAAAEPADPRAAYVENTIRAICTNPAKPLVVDTFASSTGDMFTTVRHVVGGTAPEPAAMGFGSHGDLVGTLLKRPYNAYNVPQDVPLYTLVRIFRDIASDILSGKIEKPSFINLSSGIFIHMDVMNRIAPDLELTPQNLQSKRKNALFSIIGSQGYINHYKDLYDVFKQLDDMGIITVTASGNNFSPYIINFISLLPGVITAGALSPDHTTPAPLSNTSGVDFYRPGDVFGKKAGSGMDVTNDGIRDFIRFSGISQLMRQYNGVNPEEIIKTLPPDLEQNKRFPALLEIKLRHSPPEPGIYRTTDIYEIMYGAPLNDNHHKDIALYGEYIHYPSLTPFRTDAEGKLIYDPANNGGNPSIIADYRGTSYAAPRVCELP